MFLPTDINLQLPQKTSLPPDQQHFLTYIPWDNKYLKNIPSEFVEFFRLVMPHLKPRTTDVHTAICLGFLDEFLDNFPKKKVNRRVVALAIILHDCGWSKLNEVEIASSLGVKGLALSEEAMGPKLKHAIEGEKLAKKLLQDFQFSPPLTNKETELILQAVRYHDQPEKVSGDKNPMPLEIQILVDLDHIWSFTHENFWQDTVRKGVEPIEYSKNLGQDLDNYFVTDFGKKKARKMLEERKREVKSLS